MFDLLSAYGDEEMAKRRAATLRSQHYGQDYDSHNPCTTVDILVSLLEKSSKRFPQNDTVTAVLSAL